MERKIYENQDLAGKDFIGQALAGISFENSDLSGADFTGSDLSGANFKGCNLSEVCFRNCNLKAAVFRNANLTGMNIEGADLFCANLEGAVVEDVIYDEETKYFRLYCPEEGAFIGWKKCFNYRMVQLLIPADAKRSSATSNACRCDKAKVLSIKSIDYRESFDEANSYVDENFIYRRGEMAYAGNYDGNRWNDSAGGIHFWMTREEAVGYM